jgi:uncharacterized surface protein with fasciclin (FAS1) repeats
LGLAVPVFSACGDNSGAGETTTTFAPSVLGLLTSDPTLTGAVRLLQATGRDSAIRSGTPYTLLVPTNDALDVYAKSIGLADFEALVRAVEEDPQGKGSFVANVFVEGTITGKDFPANAGETFSTLGGVDLTIGIENGGVILTAAKSKVTITAVNFAVGTVTVHVVDTVIG